jgi:hypothetical protein
VKILFANDSIIHPGLSLIYDQDERRLDLISDDEGVSSSPYVNTYHNLEMKFQKLEWKIDDDKITFGTIAGNNNQPAFFESSKYYTSTRFDNLMGIDAKHPLLTIKEFNKNYGVNNKFFVEDFKRISPYSDDQGHSLFNEFSQTRLFELQL